MKLTAQLIFKEHGLEYRTGNIVSLGKIDTKKLNKDLTESFRQDVMGTFKSMINNIPEDAYVDVFLEDDDEEDE